MFFNLQRSHSAATFGRQIGRIFDTDPLRLSSEGITVVSMVRTSDLAPYLLALKSFCTCIEANKIVAIIDHDAPSEFIRLLTWHIPGIELVEMESIPVGACQRGGTWERLLYIVDRSEHEYVIQIDADTLTIGSDLAEVRVSIAENRSFTLGGGPAGSGQQIVPMHAAAASVDFKSNYVGIVLQRRLCEYPGGETLRYVRGSSGFAGFARGGIGRQRIEEFHAHMADLLGERRREWGTEQCASNFAIANTPGAIVLPWPTYANFQPHRRLTNATHFLHFLGTVRYRNGRYASLGRRAIDRIVTFEQPHSAE